MFDRHSPIATAAEPETWALPPETMSFSRMLEIKACPRKWALKESQYPEIWDKHGYPNSLSVAAMEGAIVHRALEVIVRAMSNSGVASLASEEAVAAMRSLGGFSKVLSDATDSLTKREMVNPRVRERLGDTAEKIRSRLHILRERTQALLSRINLYPRNDVRSSDAGPLTIVNGSYSEVRVAAPEICWTGVIDLLNVSNDTCEIVEFKTGEPKPEHTTQVRVYSLLWKLDQEMNPQGRIASLLTLSYPSEIVNVNPLSDDALDDLKQILMDEMKSARLAIAHHPPRANPSPENCQFCEVRQMCDEYWQASSTENWREGVVRPQVDVEASIVHRHGPSSWDAYVEAGHSYPPKAPVLIRGTTGLLDLSPGDRIRIVGAYRTQDDAEPDANVLLCTPNTEVYFLAGRGQAR